MKNRKQREYGMLKSKCTVIVLNVNGQNIPSVRD
jgi:hypothetical protein